MPKPSAKAAASSNTSIYPLAPDVHYNAAAQKTLGMTVYDVGMAA